MSLFDWFRSAPSFESEPDRVYLTREAKWRGVSQVVAARLEENEHVFVVAHFPATLREAQQHLTALGIAATIQDRPLACSEVAHAHAAGVGSSVALVPALALVIDDVLGSDAEDRAALKVSLLVPELHPLPDRETHIEEFAESLPGRARVTRFASLEDPLVMRLCGPQVRELLKALGMTEDDPIESSMVGRRIRQAQQKLAAKVGANDEPADSVEEWMERNVRE